MYYDWNDWNHEIDESSKKMWVFSEMSFPRIGRLVHSDGGPLLIQFISDACVSSR